VYRHHLNNDFAEHKNFLNEQCNGDYIFQIDADETIHPNLLEHLHDIVGHNPEVDLFVVPRINVVTGLTDEDVTRWGWTVNEQGWNCYPDYQTRIFKNSCSIKWEGNVHERVVGYETMAPLPAEEEWSLYHIKTIERQRFQNNFYESFEGRI
jgi:glycosyltransferase involved in cell wall biosynthesis